MKSMLIDELFDHRKIFEAGERLGGPHGVAAALGFYVAGLLYANRHLTDGFVPMVAVSRFPHSRAPLVIVSALVKARLWDEVDGGFQIHDFADYNFQAETVREKRRRDRDRKRTARGTVEVES